MPRARREELLFDAEALVRVVQGEMRVLDAAPVADEAMPGSITRTADGVSALDGRYAPRVRHEMPRATQGACPSRPLAPSSV